MPTPDESKRQLRPMMRRARSGLSPEARQGAEASITDHLDALCAGVDVVGLYAAAGSEVSLDALAHRLEARGVSLAWPRVQGSELQFYRAAISALVPGYRGLREPADDAVRCRAAELDLLLVPGLGFDLQGNRLGQGGGFYDRFLASTSHLHTVGVGFRVQLVDHIPMGSADIPVTQVCTEDGCH